MITVGNERIVCRHCESTDIVRTWAIRPERAATPWVCRQCWSVDMRYVEDTYDVEKLDRLRKASAKASKQAQAALKELAAFLDGERQ